MHPLYSVLKFAASNYAMNIIYLTKQRGSNELYNRGYKSVITSRPHAVQLNTALALGATPLVY